jgi:hypothetical protein
MIEGCIQVEFKMKHYLSSNTLLGGTYNQFKLDLITREVLEIFSNQLRISIERLNILKKHQNKKPRLLGTLQGSGPIFGLSLRNLSPSRES